MSRTGPLCRYHDHRGRQSLGCLVLEGTLTCAIDFAAMFTIQCIYTILACGHIHFPSFACVCVCVCVCMCACVYAAVDRMRRRHIAFSILSPSIWLYFSASSFVVQL
ncbi:hypothetical protein BC939DRAFT_14482 [Gamsiella multidivaricata]|uniref:uncharacterized protein n=1 Tax=Gamsiella multidivaricata TaxID=101098 RepID=UPI00221F2C37|nr:uncharacterized protein BC939DRAFT_14482 [Gamsiella multidivaricata]KAI7829650.1 hypothetical protein BC939DRAFT_14482 [Gamsiella multidivaricata]